jgi:ribosome recycling factor
MNLYVQITITDEAAEQEARACIEWLAIKYAVPTEGKALSRILTEINCKMLGQPVPAKRGQSTLTTEQRRENGKKARAKRRKAATKLSS